MGFVTLPSLQGDDADLWQKKQFALGHKAEPLFL